MAHCRIPKKALRRPSTQIGHEPLYCVVFQAPDKVRIKLQGRNGGRQIPAALRYFKSISDQTASGHSIIGSRITQKLNDIFDSIPSHEIHIISSQFIARFMEELPHEIGKVPTNKKKAVHF